jgi:hypothetical protein
VFSCFNQDQLLQAVDFANLNTRLRQHSAAEKSVGRSPVLGAAGADGVTARSGP